MATGASGDAYIDLASACEASNEGAAPVRVVYRCITCFSVPAVVGGPVRVGAAAAVATSAIMRVLVRAVSCGGNIKGRSEAPIRPGVEYSGQRHAALDARDYISSSIVLSQGLFDSCELSLGNEVSFVEEYDIRVCDLLLCFVDCWVRLWGGGVVRWWVVGVCSCGRSLGDWGYNTNRVTSRSRVSTTRFSMSETRSCRA